jgi:tRNA nucleotidyltransferase (CCA-adding enzyme)
MEWFRARAEALGVEHAPPKPILLGRHLLALGLQPGPEVGAILKDIYERQLDGEIQTLDEAIAIAKGQLAAKG